VASTTPVTWRVGHCSSAPGLAGGAGADQSASRPSRTSPTARMMARAMPAARRPGQVGAGRAHLAGRALGELPQAVGEVGHGAPLLAAPRAARPAPGATGRARSSRSRPAPPAFGPPPRPACRPDGAGQSPCARSAAGRAAPPPARAPPPTPPAGATRRPVAAAPPAGAEPDGTGRWPGAGRPSAPTPPSWVSPGGG
jgi:hypothetical protein